MKCPKCNNLNLRQVTDWAMKGIFEVYGKACDLKDLKDCEGGCQ